MRLPIPPEMRAMQLWSQTVQVLPGPRPSQVPIARVQLPPEYERSWSVSLAPIVQDEWIAGFKTGSTFLYQSTGVWAIITYGTQISQFRVIDWPWGGGVYGVRGSSVRIDLFLANTFVLTGAQPPTVSAEILDVEPAAVMQRAATYSEQSFQSFGGAVGNVTLTHAPPRGAIGLRVQMLALTPAQTEPSGSIMLQGFVQNQIVNLGPPALSPQWGAWGGSNAQSGAMESLGDISAFRMIRTVAAAGPDSYRFQYRIDL